MERTASNAQVYSYLNGLLMSFKKKNVYFMQLCVVGNIFLSVLPLEVTSHPLVV